VVRVRLHHGGPQGAKPKAEVIVDIPADIKEGVDKILNKTAPENIQSGTMQTIKGLIALALVAVTVFTAVVIFNRVTDPGYEAAMEKPAVAGTGQPGIDKTSGADSHQKNQNDRL